MGLVLKNPTTTAVTNSYKTILTQLVHDKVDIDASIRKIISEKSLIKVYLKIISCDQ